MYLIALTVGLCISYFLLLFLFTAFFKNKFAVARGVSLRPVTYIILFSLLTYAVSFSIADQQMSNRVMHAFGGGFLSFLICFLVVKESKLFVGRFQFFVFSALVVTAMGVANEILEFFLQSNFHLVFSQTPDDTWLDLTSNTVGMLIAAVLLMHFVGRKDELT